MNIASRRLLLRSSLTLALATALAATGASAFAQAGKTIRLLVGFPPGGGTDAIARLLAEKLKDELGASVIVENKPGAGGQLAAQALKARGARRHHASSSRTTTPSRSCRRW